MEVTHHPKLAANAFCIECMKWTLSMCRQQWQPVIGLEIHAQLRTSQKLFSNAVAAVDAPPNSQVAAYDVALPGSLPKLNADAVTLALRAAIALNCQTCAYSRFDRKHYFYHDLPHGFQVTQKYKPLAKNGLLRLNSKRTVHIQQIQLEQDTAKTNTDPISGDSVTDLNRAGVPLIEIVSNPDLRSAEEAVLYVTKLRRLLRCVAASDGDMEKGSLRIDVNVSVKKADALDLGTRCEIKNINSLRFMKQAIQSEVDRQVTLLESGQRVQQETRGYDPITRTTMRLRSKEDAPDYRYMPDPELPPLQLSATDVEVIRKGLPLLPDAVEDLLSQKYNLGPDAITRLCGIAEDETRLGEYAPAVGYFKEVVRNGADARAAANWIAHDLVGTLSAADKTFLDNTISANHMADLVNAVTGKQITSSVAKSCLATSISQGIPLGTILQTQLLDASTIDIQELARSILAAHPTEVEAYKQGNVKVVQRLIGQAMRKSKGRADAKALGAVMSRLLQ